MKLASWMMVFPGLLEAGCATTHVGGPVACTVDEAGHARSCVSVALARRDSIIHECDGMSESVESATVVVQDLDGGPLWQFSSVELAHAWFLSLHQATGRIAAIIVSEENGQDLRVWDRNGRVMLARDLGDASVARAVLSPDGKNVLVSWEPMERRVRADGLSQLDPSGRTTLQIVSLGGIPTREMRLDMKAHGLETVWHPDGSGVHVGGEATLLRWFPVDEKVAPPPTAPACAGAASPTQALVQRPRMSCGHFELSMEAPGPGYARTPWVDRVNGMMLPPCGAH